MIRQVTSMLFFFSEKGADNEVESQNVGGDQRYKIIIKGT